MSTMEENVQRGAEKLDEIQPGWAETIRDSMTAGYFNMQNWQSCMAGTLELVRYGHEDATYDGGGLGAVVIQLNGQTLTTEREAERYGFIITDEREESWDELDRLWRVEVTKRMG